MNARQGFALGALAVLGLAFAAALGLLANAVAGDSIGLSATAVHAGRGLAPPQARHRSSEDRGHPTAHSDGGSGGAPTGSTTTTTMAEPGDERGGSESSVDNSGPGSLSRGSDDSSGSSGSNSSGSTPGGSGSSGSSGGSGSSESSGGSDD